MPPGAAWAPSHSGSVATPDLPVALSAYARFQAYRPRRWQWVLAVAALAYVMDMLDTAILNVAVPDIPTGLGTSAAQVQWTLAAHTLAFSVLLASPASGAWLLWRHLTRCEAHGQTPWVVPALFRQPGPRAGLLRCLCLNGVEPAHLLLLLNMGLQRGLGMLALQVAWLLLPLVWAACSSLPGPSRRWRHRRPLCTPVGRVCRGWACGWGWAGPSATACRHRSKGGLSDQSVSRTSTMLPPQKSRVTLPS